MLNLSLKELELKAKNKSIKAIKVYLWINF